MELKVPASSKSALAQIVFFCAQPKVKGSKISKVEEEEVTLIDGPDTIVGEAQIALYLCNKFNLPIYPQEQRSEIDLFVNDYPHYIVPLLNNYLTYRTYIVGHSFTVADIATYSGLIDTTIEPKFSRVLRWISIVNSQPFVKRFLSSLTAKKQDTSSKDVNAMKVCTRFAPEPSGYLHIGHSKAAIAAYTYAKSNKGKFILRFDDTNPDLESKEFEDIIREDVSLLGLVPDAEEHTSDYYDVLLEKIEWMLKNNFAFIDSTPGEEISRLRGILQPSPCRDQDVATNLKLFQDMKTGNGMNLVVRAKIDYESQNGCLRDPTIARCKEGHAPRFIFPMYDLACPIVDSLAGVTHAFRSWEYTDRDQQYNWFIQTLSLRPVTIISFSRLSFNYTVLGKRHLRAIVASGAAKDWADPRFPTVRGITRRGLDARTLQQFCREQGASRNQNQNDWDKLWAQNRDIISKECPRVMNVSTENHYLLNLEGEIPEYVEAPVIPKNPKMGVRKLPCASQVWIDQFDGKDFQVGQKVSLLFWSNIEITEVNHENKSIKAKLHPEDRNFKGTLKANWIAPEAGKKIIMREWNYLLQEKLFDPEKGVLQQMATVPYLDTEIICDPSFKAEKGKIYQLDRRCEIIVDEVPQDGLPITFLIPSGTSIPMTFPVKIQLFNKEDEAEAKVNKE